MDSIAFFIGVLWRLIRLARKGDVIVVKTDPPLIGLIGSIAARLRGAKLVNWWQDIFPEAAERLGVTILRTAGRPLYWLRDMTCSAAAQNIVIGRCMREVMMELAGADPERLQVIPNWSDDEAIKPLDPGNNPLRVEWGFSDSFVAGYSGNMGRGHHFELLLEAAAQLADDPATRILFIGSGARHQDALDRVGEMGLDNVIFKPFQPRDQLKYSLTVPDVHIITHRAEMYGLQVPSKFYGALAAGRPLLFIGPEGGEVARVIGEFECGFVCSGDTAGEIVDAIRRLHVEPGLAERMGQNSRRALDENYSKAISMRRWQQMLEAEL